MFHRKAFLSRLHVDGSSILIDYAGSSDHRIDLHSVDRILFSGHVFCPVTGIRSGLQSLFCPGARLEEYQEERPVEALAPCTIFLLRKENAAHNVPSLIEAFMVQLTLAGLLGQSFMVLGDSRL